MKLTDQKRAKPLHDSIKWTRSQERKLILWHIIVYAQYIMWTYIELVVLATVLNYILSL